MSVGAAKLAWAAIRKRMARRSPSGARTSMGRLLLALAADPFTSSEPSAGHGETTASTQRRHPALEMHMNHQLATTGPRKRSAAPTMMLAHIERPRMCHHAGPGAVLGALRTGDSLRKESSLASIPGPISQPPLPLSSAASLSAWIMTLPGEAAITSSTGVRPAALSAESDGWRAEPW
eukprot:scaffold206461_cov30-Tisochrysis_lutea.AAC.2